MELPDGDLSSVSILDFFVYLVSDDESAAARERFCEVVAAEIRSVASWLGFDAWLGGGDVQLPGFGSGDEPDPTRYRSFRAIGLIAQISSELIGGALVLFRAGNQYGASALIRQLIECEYLLRAFRLDFADAARWLDANDSERWDFKPSKLREIGGFDRKEHASHCRSGGHPHPAALHLLELPHKLSQLEQAAAGERRDFDTSRALWLDFAFHCERTWRALSELLSIEHARFDRVRANAIEVVRNSQTTWQQSDVLARHAAQILDALNADPATPLRDLLDLSS